jgi:hypothetical protein
MQGLRDAAKIESRAPSLCIKCRRAPRAFLVRLIEMEVRRFRNPKIIPLFLGAVFLFSLHVSLAHATSIAFVTSTQAGCNNCGTGNFTFNAATSTDGLVCMMGWTSNGGAVGSTATLNGISMDVVGGASSTSGGNSEATFCLAVGNTTSSAYTMNWSDGAGNQRIVVVQYENVNQTTYIDTTANGQLDTSSSSFSFHASFDDEALVLAYGSGCTNALLNGDFTFRQGVPNFDGGSGAYHFIEDGGSSFNTGDHSLAENWNGNECGAFTNFSLISDTVFGGYPSIASPAQYKLDHVTSISVGGSTTEGGVTLAATLTSSSSDPLELQVEVEPSGTSFTDTPTATSTTLLSGHVASTTVTGLANGSYHWQARAFDTWNSSTSAWQAFSTGTVDFVISVPTSTASVEIDSATSIFHFNDNLADSVGSNNWVSTAGSPSYVASVSSTLHDAIDATTVNAIELNSHIANGSYSGIAFWVNGKAINSSIIEDTQSGASEAIAMNATDRITVISNPDADVWNVSCAQLHSQGAGWDFVVLNTNGTTMELFVNDVSCGTRSISTLPTLGVMPSSHGSESTVDEMILSSTPFSTSTIDALWNNGHGAEACGIGCNQTSTTLMLSSLNQYKSDATTQINHGSSTTESYVTFGATLNSNGTSTLQLQVEVKPAGTAFTDTPNATSTFVSPGSSTTAIFSDPSGIDLSVYPRDPEEWSNGDFHWQARVMASSTGATSTWQLFGSAATGSVDFTINTVPLYSQSSSNYPSMSNSTGTGYWHGDPYDDGSYYCGAGNTIGYCGCAITTAVMDMRYFGVTTNVSSTDVNPKTLDDWLASSNGYNDFGDVRWEDIPLYAETSLGASTVTFDSTSSIDAASSTLVNYLLNQTTSIPVIVHESNAPDGTSTIADHFSLLTGLAYNAGTSTYTIRDSAWYDTKYFNQATTSLDTKINNYGNRYDEMRVFKPVSGGGGDLSMAEHTPYQGLFPLYLEYDTGLPNGIIVTDSQGRRSGEDPTTGTKYDEIPGVRYLHEPHSVQLIYSGPPVGEYDVNLIGAQTGKYTLEAYVFDGQHPPVPQKVYGDIRAGSMAIYAHDYNSVDLQASTLQFQGNVSSTESITTVPPHNISPPILVPPIVPPQAAPTLQTRMVPSSTPTSSVQSFELSPALTQATSTSATSTTN